uniref:Uncharacterized protein n=1 Tax=viral metagenome TaxID=1070528 RepID=A0A6C0EAA1_9ZZZZ
MEVYKDPQERIVYGTFRHYVDIDNVGITTDPKYMFSYTTDKNGIPDRVLMYKEEEVKYDEDKYVASENNATYTLLNSPTLVYQFEIVRDEKNIITGCIRSYWTEEDSFVPHEVFKQPYSLCKKKLLVEYIGKNYIKYNDIGVLIESNDENKFCQYNDNGKLKYKKNHKKHHEKWYYPCGKKKIIFCNKEKEILICSKKSNSIRTFRIKNDLTDETTKALINYLDENINKIIDYCNYCDFAEYLLNNEIQIESREIKSYASWIIYGGLGGNPILIARESDVTISPDISVRKTPFDYPIEYTLTGKSGDSLVVNSINKIEVLLTNNGNLSKRISSYCNSSFIDDYIKGITIKIYKSGNRKNIMIITRKDHCAYHYTYVNDILTWSETCENIILTKRHFDNEGNILQKRVTCGNNHMIISYDKDGNVRNVSFDILSKYFTIEDFQKFKKDIKTEVKKGSVILGLTTFAVGSVYLLAKCISSR